MNKAQKTLLKELREDSRETELLSSVKKSVDPLGRLHGDPRFKAEISLIISTVFVRLVPAGVPTIIVPAALPNELRIDIPFFVFGLTDFYGGFLKSTNISGSFLPWNLLATVICSSEQYYGYLLVYGVAPQLGDLLIFYHYLQPVTNNQYWCFLTIHCNNVAYGTFLNSFVSDLIILNQIQYSVPILNINQLLHPLHFVTQSLFGKVITGSIDPRTYITNQTFNQQIANIPVTLPIDKSLMLISKLDFDCQNINFILQVQKVKPLTFH